MRTTRSTCDRRRWSGIDRQHHRLGRPRRRRASAHPGAPHPRWTQQASPTARGRTGCWPTPWQTTRTTASPNRCPTVRPSTTAQRSPVHCISHPAVARGRRWLRTTRTWLRTPCPRIQERVPTTACRMTTTDCRLAPSTGFAAEEFGGMRGGTIQNSREKVQ